MMVTDEEHTIVVKTLREDIFGKRYYPATRMYRTRFTPLPDQFPLTKAQADKFFDECYDQFYEMTYWVKSCGVVRFDGEMVIIGWRIPIGYIEEWLAGVEHYRAKGTTIEIVDEAWVRD